MAKKLVRKTVGFCRYCTHFYRTGIRKKGDSKGPGSRFCRPNDDWVTLDDPACDDFETHRYVWCDNAGSDKRNYWLKIGECLRRQETEDMQTYNCDKCKEASIVKSLPAPPEPEVVVETEPEEEKPVKRKRKKLKRRPS